MKRKMLFCALALTALLMIGCGSKTTLENTGTANNQTNQTAQNNSGTAANQAADTNHAGENAAANQAENNTANQQTTHDGNETANQAANTATDGTTENGTAAGSSHTQTGEMLSEEKAREIALSHAGLTEEHVTFIKSGLDRDDGKKNYDVEFYTSDGKEYDYEIDPYTGEILDYDYDAEYYPHSDSPAGTADRNADSNSGTDGKKDGENHSSAKTKISEDEAKKIVLAKIPGASHEHFLEFKSDYDNSRLEYEGKVYYNEKEYEFEIDGHTGDILEWDEETIHVKK